MRFLRSRRGRDNGTRPRPYHQGSPSRSNHSLDHSNFPEAKRRCPRAINSTTVVNGNEDGLKLNPDVVYLARRSKGESCVWYDSRGTAALLPASCEPGLGHGGPDCLLKLVTSVIESDQS